ncbi:hypothetical protein YTPLAS18_31420 [Nitrospira sp.]|nr:hypothetical protein YTPLAS18_31420 [Nitrospira sp.]
MSPGGSRFLFLTRVEPHRRIEASCTRVVFWLVLMMMWVGTPAQVDAKDDVVILKNGDRITGKIRSMESDELEIATQHSGTIKIGWGEIQHIQPAEPLSVTVHRDVEIPEEAGERDGDHVIVKELSADGPLPMEYVKSIGVTAPYQRGNFNLGGNHASGNSNTSALNVSATYILRQQWHRVQMSGKFNRGEANGELAAENGSLSASYDYLLSRRFFISGQILEETDKFQLLTLRSTTTLAPGYYFYDRADRTLSIGVGPSLVYQKFRPEPSTVVPSASWFVHWYRDLPGGRVNLFHDHKGYRDLDDHGALRIDAQQGIRVNIYGDLSFNFEYDIRFNSNPVQGKKEVDSSIIFGLSYGFER